MKTLLRRPGFGGFLFAQAQVAFNDNATKLILIGLVQWLLPANQAGQLVSVISLLLVAPFVLFAPFTGWLADRYDRRRSLAGRRKEAHRASRISNIPDAGGRQRTRHGGLPTPGFWHRP